MRVIQFVSISAGALLLSEAATYAADAAHGLDLAKRWCASCHVVSPDQKHASADVPPFAAIAKSPDFDAKRLAYFLLEPHPKMPQMALSRSAADDIAAYIATLRK
jgi:mono/diheme cytochrome c family protein